MSSEKKFVPFQGTKEQEEQLRKVIADHKGQRGALMPVLQQAQEIYGYLPAEVQQIISDEMKIPVSKICGYVLFFLFAVSEGQVPDFRMPGYCVLCKRL